MSDIGLKKDCLPENTRKVFEWLAAEPLLKDFILIGGTALALQIGHRFSEDLDFWIPNEVLSKPEIAKIIKLANDNKFNPELAMSSNSIIAAKINGLDLLLYSQDYKINNVKVTFFARNDGPYQYFNGFDKISSNDISFSIMAEEGMLVMKSYVIHQRTRSRDIFDLYSLMKKGCSLNSILDYGKKADAASSIEYAKAVLIGLIPLDEDDEGLEAIGETLSMTDMYDFFKQAVDDHEVAMTGQLKTILKNAFD